MHYPHAPRVGAGDGGSGGVGISKRLSCTKKILFERQGAVRRAGHGQVLFLARSTVYVDFLVYRIRKNSFCFCMSRAHDIMREMQTFDPPGQALCF